MTFSSCQANFFPKWEEDLLMKLIGKEVLIPLWKTSIDVSKWLSNWCNDLDHAKWKHESELLRQYPNATNKGKNIFLFQISNSNLLIKVKISFLHGIILIDSLSE